MKRAVRRRLWPAAALCVLLLCGSAGQAQNWPAWEGYRRAFIDPQGRVVDPQAGERTTSEGQAYGLFFALVNGDRPLFAHLLGWTQNNLAAGDLGANLPAWLWGKAQDGSWRVLDPHPAADADLWLAYTLLEAGRLWREPRYDLLARRMMAEIAAREVFDLPGFGPLLAPGATGFHPNARTWILNPSYMPLFLLVRLGEADPSGPWKKIAGNLPALFEKSCRNSYVMDWVSYNPGEGFLPAALPGAVPGGSYDAIRVYLWAGLGSRKIPDQSETLRLVSGMASYLDTHALPPERVGSAGISVGRNAPLGFSAALLPYLQALGKTASLARQRAVLEAQWNPQTGLFGRSPSYYDENLALFGTGAVERRFRFNSGGRLEVQWRAQ